MTLDSIRSKLYAPSDALMVAAPKVVNVGKVVSSAGECGDIVFLMCVLKSLPGGPHTVLLRSAPGVHKTSDFVVRHPEVILPLLRSQSYINEARMWGPGDKEHWCSSNFRDDGCHGAMVPLVQAHALHGQRAGVVPKMVFGGEKWLDITPIDVAKTRVVIARTDRWRNHHFPWKQIWETYGNQLLMLGTRQEHQTFEAEIGPVEYCPTDNLLLAAQIIARSWLFISNQTSLYAIAEGLKVRRILECNLQQTDCVYQGGEVQHILDGEVILPLLGGGSVHIPSPIPKFSQNVSTMIQPPEGGWAYADWPRQPVFRTLHDRVMVREGLDAQEAKKRILERTYDLCPGIFPSTEREDLKARLRHALEISVVKNP